MASRRGKLRKDLGPLGPHIDSFTLSLRIAERSPRTIEMYEDAVRWFAAWALDNTDIGGWKDVNRDHLRGFFLHMQEPERGYEQTYRNNIARCVQAYFKWFAEEEALPNPFSTFKAPPPPKVGEKVVPVISRDDLRALVKDAEAGRDFESRRDAALLRLFACTGCRLSEITHLQVTDVDIPNRTATVTGKGKKQRTVKFDQRCALALDRYLRKRATHKAAGLSALWLSVRHKQGRTEGMTPSGVRQVIERRGERLGLDIHPHLFRHTFSHNWLDEGGAEGDLMELNGWDSPQMLRHYGASAKAARARRAYDRVNVMHDI